MGGFIPPVYYAENLLCLKAIGMLLTDGNKAHELLFHENRVSRILIIYDRNELGDYLHKILPFVFLIKCKKPFSTVDLLNLKEPKACVTFLTLGMNFCRTVHQVQGAYDFIYVFDCSKYLFPGIRRGTKFLRWALRIKVPPALQAVEGLIPANAVGPALGPSETFVYITQKRFFLWNQLQDSVLEYIPYYTKYYRQKLLAYFRERFYKGIPGLSLTDITINIGSFNKNRGANNNMLFQDRMAEVIRLNPRKRFNILGYSDELVSRNLKGILSDPTFNINNLIDKIDKTHGMGELLNVLFRSRFVIVRNTGILHLAGLCNSPLITLSANHDLGKTFGLRSDVQVVNHLTSERNHLVYHEKWSPFADSIVSINEYKSLCPGYNVGVAGLISQGINYIPYIVQASISRKALLFGLLSLYLLFARDVAA